MQKEEKIKVTNSKGINTDVMVNLIILLFNRYLEETNFFSLKKKYQK